MRGRGMMVGEQLFSACNFIKDAGCDYTVEPIAEAGAQAEVASNVEFDIGKANTGDKMRIFNDEQIT